MVAYKGMPKLTEAERAHLELILAQPCLACLPPQTLKTEAHHIVENGRRLGPFFLTHTHWPTSKILPRVVT